MMHDPNAKPVKPQRPTFAPTARTQAPYFVPLATPVAKSTPAPVVAEAPAPEITPDPIPPVEEPAPVETSTAIEPEPEPAVATSESVASPEAVDAEEPVSFPLPTQESTPEPVPTPEPEVQPAQVEVPAPAAPDVPVKPVKPASPAKTPRQDETETPDDFAPPVIERVTHNLVPGARVWLAPTAAALAATANAHGRRVRRVTISVGPQTGRPMGVTLTLAGGVRVSAQDFVSPNSSEFEDAAAFEEALKDAVCPNRWWSFGIRVPARVVDIVWDGDAWKLTMSTGGRIVFRELVVEEAKVPAGD